MTAVLTDPLSNFTYAPWTLAGATQPSTVAARNGNGAQCAATATSLAKFTIPGGSEDAWVIVGFAVNFAAGFGTGNFFRLLSDTAATTHTCLGMNSDGSISIVRGTISTLVTSAAGVITANTWYYLELRFHLGDSTAGSVELKVNGTTVATNTACDTKNAGTKTTYDTVQFNGMSGSTTRYDDLYVLTGSGETFRGDTGWSAATVSATLAATWGGWTAASTTLVHTTVPAVLAATWGSWSGALVSSVHKFATLAATWGGWTAASTAILDAGELPGIILRAPAASHGHPSGLPNWNVSVEMLMPSDATSVLGTMILGTSKLATNAWYDVTDRMQGCVIDRGGSAGDRPEPGTMTLQLDNTEMDLSPWTAADYFLGAANVYLGPGTVTRVAAHDITDPDVWQPLFTGIVEQWEEVTEAFGRTGSVVVTCIDTMSTLAQVEENAVDPVGAGEGPNERIQRLADASAWKFGTLLEYAGAATLQDTDLSQNRITEMYLVADSVDELLKSGRDGRIRFGQKDSRYVDDPDEPQQVLNGGRLFFTGNPRLHLGTASHASQPNWVPASVDDFRTRNNDDLIYGVVTLARVGGSAVTATDTTVNGRYQRRTYTRSDLITEDPGADADLTYVADRILARSDETYRPDFATISGLLDPKCLQFLFSCDVGLVVPIYSDHVTFLDYTICSYSLSISPMNEHALDIAADVYFEPNVVSSWVRV